MGVDLRTRTTLVCGALALAIGIATLLRGRARRVHLLFAAFAGDLGLWYLSQSAYGFFGAPIWPRFTGAMAVLLPQLALHLFNEMGPEEDRRKSRLLLVTNISAVPMLAMVLSAEQSKAPVRISVFVYVFILLTAGLYALWKRGRKSPSRATQRRVQFLVVTGALAGLASVVDFVWYFGATVAPIGAALSVVFLFVLAQALRRDRLLDLYEILARLLVATAVAFLIAFIFYILLRFLGDFSTIYLNAVLAAIIVLVLFDPMKDRVEEQIQRFFLRDRRDLERAVAESRRLLAHVLEMKEMASVVMRTLEDSRRVTDAALYVRDQDGTGFDRVGSLSREAPEYIDVAALRAILDKLEGGALDLEVVERDVRKRRALEEPADAGELVLAAANVLGSLCTGVVVGIRNEAREVMGLLVVKDERIRDAFSIEERALLEQLATQINVVLENSRLYAQLKERDKLTLLGQMAAGIAHEIRNPLGAIKGAAQLLAEPSEDVQLEASAREFVGIILEEVERLDKVVGSVLDLARPNQAVGAPIDVNAVIRRTLQVLAAEPGHNEIRVETALEPELPRVNLDPEQLRQVLMNLFRNAAQAMRGRGQVTISTRIRLGRGTRSVGTQSEGPFVELTVADHGPGMSQKLLESIFLPFFTTKEKGTGLGLAISQRIIQSAGGRIEVRSSEGKGSSFAVIIPANRPILETSNASVMPS